MARPLRPALAALLLGACLAVPGAAAAPPTLTEIYNRHVEAAERRRQEKRFDEAIDELRAAYAILADPVHLLNQGHSYLALNRPRDALRLYRRYKEKRGPATAEEDEKLQRYVDRAQALADRLEEPPPDGWRADGTPVARLVETLIVKVKVPERAPPLYRRWWFWTGVGAVVAAGVVTGVVVGTQGAPPAPPPTPDLGALTYRPMFP